jgi:hypothetical protein
MKTFVIRIYGRYHVHSKTHGHPKTCIRIEDAKKYTSEISANKAAHYIYGNMAEFQIITLTD